MEVGFVDSGVGEGGMPFVLIVAVETETGCEPIAEGDTVGVLSDFDEVVVGAFDDGENTTVLELLFVELDPENTGPSPIIMEATPVALAYCWELLVRGWVAADEVADTGMADESRSTDSVFSVEWYMLDVFPCSS